MAIFQVNLTFIIYNGNNNLARLLNLVIYFERGKTIAGNIRRELAASPPKLNPRSTGLESGNTILDPRQSINDRSD